VKEYKYQEGDETKTFSSIKDLNQYLLENKKDCRYLNGKFHHVFRSESDFTEHFDGSPPEIKKEWHTAQEGDWVISGDKAIVQILRRHEYGPDKNASDGNFYGYIGTVVGTFRLSRDLARLKPMDTDWGAHENRYSYSGRLPAQNKYRLTVQDKMTIEWIGAGHDPITSYTKAHKTNNVEYAYIKIKWLFKQEVFMAKLREEIREAAKAAGIDVPYILEAYKEVADNGKMDKDKLAALDRLAFMIEATPIQHGGKLGPGKSPREQGYIEDAEFEELETRQLEP